jgi:uncharacterized protein YrzB (UPF0473 family)
MDEKKTIIVLDKDGKEKEAEIIFMFEIEETKKNYILYTLNEKDENDMVRIYTSCLIERDGMYSLSTIESDEEWMTIKEVMKKLAQDGQAQQ